MQFFRCPRRSLDIDFVGTTEVMADDFKPMHTIRGTTTEAGTWIDSWRTGYEFELV